MSRSGHEMRREVNKRALLSDLFVTTGYMSGLVAVAMLLSLFFERRRVRGFGVGIGYIQRDRRLCLFADIFLDYPL